MKKIVSLLLAVVLGLALGLPVGASAEEPTFLVLLYLCGTDLESEISAATADFVEILEAELDVEGPIMVLVHAGGTDQWATGLLESGESQRFLVYDDVYPESESLGKLDMGDPDTLADFVSYGLETYPADRTALILWDHGGGATAGVCYDEISGNSLEIGEIYTALSQGLDGKKLSFIGFDACLMSTFEVAAHLYTFADYMIASEELEPGAGWRYDVWLSALKADPSMSTEDLGKTVVDSFIDGALRDDPDDYVTLALTDLNQMEPLMAAVDTFSGELQRAIENGQFATISRARARMKAFGDFMDSSSDMVDLAELAYALQEIAPTAAKALGKAVKQAVPYARSSANIKSAAGLSILIPDKTKAKADEYMPTYNPEFLISGYTDFVMNYLSKLTGGTYHFAPSQIETQAMDMEDEETQSWFADFASASTSTSSDADSWWDDDSQEGEEEPEQPANMTQDDYVQAAAAYGNAVHTVQLSKEDMENLSFVEASLLQDAREEVGDAYGEEVYFDFGLMQDVHVDWAKGIVYGLFNGNWPTLEGQMVPMYDQVVTEGYTRSLIPAMVNGREKYLLVVFNAENPGGAVVGYTEGYDDNGNPARGYDNLKKGDLVVPLFDLMYWDADEEMQLETYQGEAIEVGDKPLEFGRDAVEEGVYFYSFCLNDVFGDYQFTDFAELEY